MPDPQRLQEVVILSVERDRSVPPVRSGETLEGPFVGPAAHIDQDLSGIVRTRTSSLSRPACTPGYVRTSSSTAARNALSMPGRTLRSDMRTITPTAYGSSRTCIPSGQGVIRCRTRHVRRGARAPGTPALARR